MSGVEAAQLIFRLVEGRDGAEKCPSLLPVAPRGGMSQYALRHMRFADLLPVPRRQGIPRLVEHGAQELNCFWNC
jgi:hypothetical protein